jgi:uncharacterized membrane protein
MIDRIEHKKTALLTAALAGLMMTSGSAAADVQSAKASEKVSCYGANACKGKGECGGKDHSCHGKNACKGQGRIMLPKDECLKIEGASLKPPEAKSPKK